MPTPLVVITTNEERELPAAFIRRCLVLNLQLAEATRTLSPPG
jgi:MoxR-like ATPase